MYTGLGPGSQAHCVDGLRPHLKRLLPLIRLCLVCGFLVAAWALKLNGRLVRVQLVKGEARRDRGMHVNPGAKLGQREVCRSQQTATANDCPAALRVRLPLLRQRAEAELRLHALQYLVVDTRHGEVMKSTEFVCGKRVTNDPSF